MTALSNHRLAALAYIVVVGVCVTSQIFGDAPAAQSVGLKIVVIQGEDAINIIQQKSAVAPVVEVRDRNDLPVAGVPVSFTVAGPNATFGGGLQTISVTTNAAGRAAVTSLTPVNAGAVRINVSASVQGQTATATIAQTNFATAAAAAAAGMTVAAAGAGAAAGGSGLSAAAVAGIVGGAAAGGLAAAKVAGGGDRNETLAGGAGGDETLRPACTLSVSPTSLGPFTSEGGTAAVSINASQGACNPADWTASDAGAGFVTVNPTRGSGPGVVTVTVQPNPLGDRSATITIAGQAVTVTQTNPPPTCDRQETGDGAVSEVRHVELGRSSGTFRFSWDGGGTTRFVIFYEDFATLFDSGCPAPASQTTVSYSGTRPSVNVRVIPNCNTLSQFGGLPWRFTVSCPQ